MPDAPPPPATQREALVALSNLFATLAESPEDGTVVLEQAIAVLAAGVVVSRGADYEAGTFGAITVTKDGRVRIEASGLDTLQAILEELRAIRQQIHLTTGCAGD
jgi:hypothetical protein